MTTVQILLEKRAACEVITEVCSNLAMQGIEKNLTELISTLSNLQRDDRHLCSNRWVVAVLPGANRTSLCHDDMPNRGHNTRAVLTHKLVLLIGRGGPELAAYDMHIIQVPVPTPRLRVTWSALNCQRQTLMP